MMSRRPSSVRKDVLKMMGKGELQLDLCGKMESTVNQESEGCNPDPFLKITARKLLIRWNWLAEERLRNMIPIQSVFLLNHVIEKMQTRLTFGTEKNLSLFRLCS